MTDDERARKAADGLARRHYESGGPDAVKRSEKLRQEAVKDLMQPKPTPK